MSSRKPKASLFVTTFEMPRHLELVCAGLNSQSFRDFEILFCDDGSGKQTREIISCFKASSGFPVQHVWQDHQGFRKCRILNQALRQARGDTLIFLDGDCIPHRDYVLDHLDHQQEGYYLAGRRVELGPKFSAQISPEMVRLGYFDRPRISFIRSIWDGDSAYLNRSIRIRSPQIRSLLGMNHVTDLKGCNYSLPRSALESLNGFDESYEGYGREDTDVEIRLQNLGLKIKSLKGLALQFHVWHPRREFTPENDQRLDDAKGTGRVRCEKGLVQN